MSNFDTAMASHSLPTAEDLEITIPFRRVPRVADSESIELPELGQHGGSSDGSASTADAHSDGSSSSAAAETAPEPQRDDPDEGEHTDSTEEQVARRAAASPVHTAEPEQRDERVAEPQVAPGPIDLEIDEESTSPALRADTPLEEVRGTDPLTFKKIGGASYGDGVELVGIKRLPQVGIDKLRVFLAETTGPDFASAISAPALITAFLVANLGIKLDLDQNTRAAVNVFREANARVSVVEDKVDHVLDNIDQMAAALKVGLRRMAETSRAVDAVDLATSYLVADRVAGLSTADIDETNINVGQKKVLTARTRIHEQALTQRKIEQDRNERSNA